MAKKHKPSGFTIVELLIVIVVIAILAAISIVAYNGIQTRAENNKTLVAASAYHKAIKMYEVDFGKIPQISLDSCLGENYTWDFTGSASGNNQCRYTSSSYYIIRGSLNSDLKKYITPLPTPSMQVVGSATNWSRGITYQAEGASPGTDIALAFALKATNSCPATSGMELLYSEPLSNGVRCVFKAGLRA